MASSNIDENDTPTAEILQIGRAMDHVVQPFNNAQAPFYGNIDFYSMAFNPPNTLYSDEPSIESAMEGFMADYLHYDWGWNPFLVSVSLSDYYDNC